MANTRFYYDPCRTKKSLQQSTGPGRYILNVPGNGADPCYMEDPQIIIQKWGANLQSNSLLVENELRNLNRPLSRDLNTYKRVDSQSYQFPVKNFNIDESRASLPAWTFREKGCFTPLPLKPQTSVDIPFQNNLQSRTLEKDYYKPNY